MAFLLDFLGERQSHPSDRDDEAYVAFREWESRLCLYHVYLQFSCFILHLSG